MEPIMVLLQKISFPGLSMSRKSLKSLMIKVVLLFFMGLIGGLDSKEIPDLTLSQTQLTNLKPTIVAKLIKDKDEKTEAVDYRIGIPIRGTADDKDGKGTFYDHFVFQKLTDLPTEMILPGNMTEEDIYSKMRSYVDQLPYTGVKGKQDDRVIAKDLPKVQAGYSFDCGLLVIPGRMRDREDNIIRQQHEEALLRHALLRGQPILAICAGSWRLWQALWTINLYPDYEIGVKQRDNLKSFIKKVEDHTASRMMSLSLTTPKVTYNIMMHGLKFMENSLLYQMMVGKEQYLEDMHVNSVHWKAPVSNPNALQESTKYPFGIEIGVVSKNTKELEVKNRNNKIMVPTEGEIEGFSSIYGAPVIGVGWHPEASNSIEELDKYSSYNISLIKKMAHAGKAYQHKRALIKEINELRKD
jgi:gamma-glutamyl-gamma-aminobutyrate hydrolase PuuD